MVREHRYPGYRLWFEAGGAMPPPVEPVPAAPDACFGCLLYIRLIRLVNGTIAILANQGVAHTLKIRRKGSNALVMAYAVANLQESRQTSLSEA